MALSSSLKSKAFMVEKTTTLGVASGTTVGPAVSANTMVISSGIEFVTAAGSAGTSATVAIGDGVTANLAAVTMQGKAAGTILGGVVPSFVSADDTIDAVLAVSGSGLVAATVRIWAIVVDCNENTQPANEVDRDNLA
jgi:DNA-binding transcriptional regulator LsrR (DeoR family)|tara:strand:- start:1118 stop:1531 length:414 start_codon:yes stop_codon:yes gene_type:complete